MKRRSSPALAHLEEALADLDARGLLRRRPEPFDGARPSFCSNDYLGLATRAVSAGPAGAGASRLVVGEADAHRALESAIAGWLDAPAALLFSSGYAANVGVLSALVAPGDLVVSDALNHASIIDGCRLARAEVTVVPHLDAGAVERALGAPRRGRAWVVTESYFSMDADSPDLATLRAVCDAHGAALLVDEAHAFGVLGPGGRGVCAAAGVRPDVWIGTLGKAFGAQGAFVAGDEPLIEWLWNRARSFVFSTGLSPALATAALGSFHEATSSSTLRDRCLARAAELRSAIAALEPLGHGPIVPIVLGAPERALAAAGAAREAGIHVQAIRPPTVPAGTSRLRITTTARHTPEDVAAAAEALLRAAR